MPSVEYRYELRRCEEVIATGHLSRERPLEVGEHIAIGGRAGIVRVTFSDGTLRPAFGRS